MLITLKNSVSGQELELELHKNDLVISLKSFLQKKDKSTASKLIKLSINETELDDKKYIGNYKDIKDSAVIIYHVPLTQPYSKVNYAFIKAKMEETVKKKPLEAFFDPREFNNDWIKEWNKGNEYLNYPPINYKSSETDIRSIPGGYEVESSKQAEFYENFEKYMKNMLKRGRHFSSDYFCKVKGFKYNVLHKLEGKWSGTAIQYSSQTSSSNSSSPNPSSQKMNSCSSKLIFDDEKKIWSEIQTYTEKSGLSSSTIFQYFPCGDHCLEAFCDDKRLMERVQLTLKEDEDNLILIGRSRENHMIVLIENIIINGEKRTRTITRFNNDGKYIGVVICSEQKVIDEETGAITPFN